MANPPAIVEVAVVEVAKKCERVGVEVATRFPLLLMDASIFVPRPEKVMVEEVAMIPATERLPEMRASPWTERRVPGVVVPIPTEPK